jgi:hypothetical protein
VRERKRKKEREGERKRNKRKRERDLDDCGAALAGVDSTLVLFESAESEWLARIRFCLHSVRQQNDVKI